VSDTIEQSFSAVVAQLRLFNKHMANLGMDMALIRAQVEGQGPIFWLVNDA